jgi:hypothetical protein
MLTCEQVQQANQALAMPTKKALFNILSRAFLLQCISQTTLSETLYNGICSFKGESCHG